MKKILLIVIAVILGMAKVVACGPYGANYNAYVFSLCPSPMSYSQNNDQRLADAWSALIGQKVTVAQSRQLAEITLAELDTLNNPIARYALKNQEVGSYVRLLVSYLNNANFSYNSWNYPSAEEISQYNKNLQKMLNQAAGYSGKLLSDRYYLLRLRILFRQNNYNAIVALWEKQPLQGSSVFVDMARDYYAGALYHLGRQEDAAVQYALSGNLYDAHQCMRNMHGAQCLSRVVQQDPNSPVLPYMLEEIVNGSRESYEYYTRVALMRNYLGQCITWEKAEELKVPYMNLDYRTCPDGQWALASLPSMEEWFSLVSIYKVTQEEYKVVNEVIERQLADKKVKDRCMWMSAKAYLHYLKADYDKAWEEIQQAMKMLGSPASISNACYLCMLLSTRQHSLKVMESTLAKWLPSLRISDEDIWVSTSADGSYTYYDYETPRVSDEDRLNYLVKNGIVDRYLREGDSVMATMAWSLLCQQYGDTYSYLPSSHSEHYSMFCALSLGKQQQLLDLMGATSKQGALVRYLCGRLPFVRNDYLDVMGTMLILNGRFAEAIKYLKQVPLDFIERQPIAPYAAMRSIQDLPWEKTLVDEAELSGNVKLSKNAKVEFCQEVLALQKHIKIARGEDLYEGQYNLGALYHQASEIGSCWWLARYAVSTVHDKTIYDSAVEDQFDFLGQSRNLLLGSLASQRADLRYKAYYLLLHQGHDNLYYGAWNDDYSAYNFVLNAESKYYPILLKFKSDLYNRAGQPDFVSHCDDLVQMYALIK